MDFGIKRCGIAVTDILQIIVSPLKTVETKDFLLFLSEYLKHEQVEKIVFGLSKHKDGTDNYIMNNVRDVVEKIKKRWPELIVDYQDEFHSSTEAFQIILQSGVSQKKRRDKSLMDKISAVIILQRYLKHI